MQTYEVFLDRCYAPGINLPPGQPLAGCYIKAANRTAAALVAWDRYRSNWLPLITAPGSAEIGLKISLNAGVRGAVASASRLEPIVVEVISAKNRHP